MTSALFKLRFDISCISSIAFAIVVEFAFEEQDKDIILAFAAVAVRKKRSFQFPKKIKY